MVDACHRTRPTQPGSTEAGGAVPLSKRVYDGICTYIYMPYRCIHLVCNTLYIYIQSHTYSVLHPNFVAWKITIGP